MEDSLPKPSLLHLARTAIPGKLSRALVISQVLAVVWWLTSLWFQANSPTPVWYDQSATFTQLGAHLADPYSVKGFVNPPWTAVLLAPFGLLPLPAATLLQLCLYFAILTAVIFKFGGSTRTVVIALTSFVAFDAALELNLGWLVCLGLLVPPALSGPFLLVRPQDALGYWLSFKRRELVRAVIIVLIVLIASLVLWGMWPVTMWNAIRQNTLGRFYNLAPIALLPPVSVVVSIAVGLFLAWRALKRHDPVLGVLAWLFFVPYITLYALLLPLAMLAIRFPRFVLLISVSMWIIYGRLLLLYFLRP